MQDNQQADAKRPDGNVSIRVAYPWSKSARHPREDARWTGIRKFAESCAATAVAKEAKRSGIAVPATENWVDVARLRGMAGAFLSDVIFQRLACADILIADISGDNPNVMLEVGAAIASGRVRVFLLKTQTGSEHPQPPSDLHGYFVTALPKTTDDDSDELLKLLSADVSLRAALTGAIQARLRERMPADPVDVP